ncbi:MAG: ATPase, P-type (Transporting), HAD superfamily, subfamily IC [Microgenomates group bacterium GW2011_GWB1_45_17]|nr:MAG: ATPase, P-type (Transporting), HAD superfamily, subfamily IC [Microgenomates group bacterium GW2011_GWB1_45_17]
MIQPTGTGLRSEDISRLRDQFGYNTLPKARELPVIFIFLKQFRSLFVFILLFAGSVSYYLHETLDAYFIFFIVLLNASISFLQEMRAKHEIAALKKLLIPYARVIRDGKEKLIKAKSLLPGDVVILTEGDSVPADCEILSTSSLSVNEASLTGESVPVPKGVHDAAFMATTVLSGKAVALVTKTGAHTAFGQIAQRLSEIHEEHTPLEKKLSSLGRVLGIGIGFLILLIWGIGLMRGERPYDMFLSAVALAVAAIPEGLIAVLTIALAFGVKRLAGKKAIVKRLPAVEALGSVDVICTDKTGTLTKNEMVVKHLVTPTRAYTVTGIGYTKSGEIIEEKTGKRIADLATHDDLSILLHISALCNTSSLALVEDGGKEFRVLGDTTEGSLLILVEKSGLSTVSLREQFPTIEEYPFDSNRKAMAVHTATHAYAKGAAESILQFCSSLNEKEKEIYRKKAEDFGRRGFRVLAFAHKRLSAHYTKGVQKETFSGYTFAGLVAISDPPREEVTEALRICKRAGIMTVMLTGDSPETARSIAESIGLIDHDDEILTGQQLAQYEDSILRQHLSRVRIFARVTPTDKLRIVRAFQEMGRVVAVTGDGVNDAPALKKAEVGVAMGMTGTDVAKEASDIVITDDNFATIVAAIQEGRTVFTNLTHTIVYLLSSNLGEVCVMFGALLFGLPLPLLPPAILWINIVTDGLPALALAIDPSDGRTMLKKYQVNRTALLTRENYVWIGGGGIGQAVIALSVFAFALSRGLSFSRGAVFTTLVALELLVVFLVRGKHTPAYSNRFLIITVVISAVLQGIILAVPQIRSVFF